MSSPELDVILCPDCGGVVGATAVTEHGPPCRCFADQPKPRAQPALSDPPPLENSASAVEDEPAPTDTSTIDPDAAQSEKRCVVCDKNVSGHRRLKDSRGYICLDCAKKEKRESKPKGVKCPKCFRVVKPNSLAKHDGRSMCQRCLREARDLAKPGSKRFRKIDDKHFEEHSKVQLYVLIGVAAVLGVIILIGWLKS